MCTHVLKRSCNLNICHCVTTYASREMIIHTLVQIKYTSRKVHYKLNEIRSNKLNVQELRVVEDKGPWQAANRHGLQKRFIDEIISNHSLTRNASVPASTN